MQSELFILKLGNHSLEMGAYLKQRNFRYGNQVLLLQHIMQRFMPTQGFTGLTAHQLVQS
jgi:hypothetical protein